MAPDILAVSACSARLGVHFSPEGESCPIHLYAVPKPGSGKKRPLLPARDGRAPCLAAGAKRRNDPAIGAKRRNDPAVGAEGENDPADSGRRLVKRQGGRKTGAGNFPFACFRCKAIRPSGKGGGPVKAGLPESRQ
ncbi:hypothetical protein B4135_1942 [Caldibacillus debilis]|uniref:Uncharacterized protein n=1 Tax=Caldibacillus debilis TaxID=301148 RepID=A0A150M733_9BACI|nr:hypothetical protein B4135_1942 [Caldibacillus debilis]